MRKKNMLVCGVGINDLDENIKVNGKHLPFYACWRTMLQRCYSEKCQINHPTYIGCSVCEEWKYLSNFRRWFDLNYVERFQLDKDILIDDNKLYSPDTCCFVPKYLNTLFTDHRNARGDLPLGITRNHNGYMAQCWNGNGKQLNKTFKILEEAVAWYSTTKKRIVAEQVQRALNEGAIDQRIADALLRRKLC